MGILQLTPEVFVADAGIVKVRRDVIDLLKGRVEHSGLQRIRLCAHRDTNDSLHEMLIVLGQGTYVRPHKHVGKSESFHLIEGVLDVVIFDDSGAITTVVEMGDYGSGRCFYYRISEPAFHTVLLRSSLSVLHETTNGPFNPSGTMFASWAPEQLDTEGRRVYLDGLAQSVAAFLADARQGEDHQAPRVR